MSPKAKREPKAKAKSTKKPAENPKSGLMPPAQRQDSKVPKPVKEIREYFQAKGESITPESLEGLDRQTRMRLFSCLSTSLQGRPDGNAKYQDYRKLTADKDRREWLSTFILDPASGGCVGKVETSVSHQRSVEATEQWVTEAELAGPRFLNNEQHAAWYVQEVKH